MEPTGSEKHALWLDRRLPYVAMFVVTVMAAFILNRQWVWFNQSGLVGYADSAGLEYVNDYVHLLIDPWLLLAPGLLLSPILAWMWLQRRESRLPSRNGRIPLFPILNYWTGIVRKQAFPLIQSL